MSRPVFITALLLAATVTAQPFQIVEDSAPLLPVTGGQVVLQGQGDDGRAVVPLGFTFPYHGRAYTAVTVTANGLAFLEPDGCSTCGYAANSALDAAVPRAVLAPFWDDLRLDAPGGGIFAQQGTENGAPAFTVEWRNTNSWFATSQYRFTFQLTLNALGEIVLHHGTLTGQGVALSGTVGISSVDGTQGRPSLACAQAAPWCTAADVIPGHRMAYRAPPGVELSGSQLVLAALSSVGGQLSVSAEATFRNAGGAPAAGINWALFLSADRVFQPGVDAPFQPALLGPLPLPARGSGSQVAGGSVARPASGDWYVLAVADADQSVVELDETDNVVASERPLSAGMNLDVVSVEGPAASGPGEAETVTVRVRNTGMDAPGQLVKLAVYLSTDEGLDAADVKVGERYLLPVPLDDFPVDVAVQVPATLLPGPYRFVARLDDAGVIAELSEGDNVKASTPVVLSQVDLAVRAVVPTATTAPFVPSTRLFLGEPQRVVVAVENQGGATAQAATVSLYFSENEQLNAVPDQWLGSLPVSLLPGARLDVPFNVTIPAADKLGRPWPVADYVLLAVITSAVDANTSDNVRGTGFRRFQVPGPDFQVLAVQGPKRAAAGERFQVQVRLRNDGIRALTAVPWRYLLSGNPVATETDPLVPRVVAGALVAEELLTLQPGEELLRVDEVEFPPGLAPGTWRLGVRAEVAGDLAPADNALAPWAVELIPAAAQLQVVHLPDALAGTPYFYALADTVPGVARFVAASLPLGLTLSDAGLLSGTPSQPGTYALALILEVGSVRSPVTAVVRVLPPSTALAVATPSLPVVARLGNYTWALSASGGVAPYRWSLADGVLPEGLLLSEAGRLSGRTSAGEGSRALRLRVADAAGTVAERTLSLRVVGEGSLLITSVSPPVAQSGVEYAADLVAERVGGGGLEGPLTWRKVSGELPPGLEMQGFGGSLLVRGTPAQAGLFAVTFEVEDGKGRSDQAAVVFQVLSDAGFLQAEFVPARPGEPASGRINGPAGARAFRLVGGALPGGVSMDAAGRLAGTVDPDARAGLYPVTVVAVDGLGGALLGGGAFEVLGDGPRPEAGGCSAAPGAVGWGLAAWLLCVTKRGQRRSRRT